MGLRERRVVQRPGHLHQQYASVEQFLAADDPASGVLTIEDQVPIDILYLPTGSDTTYVIFNPAIASRQVILPVFSGAAVTADGRPNRIFVSDPALAVSDQLQFGCYAGVKGMDLQSLLPRILGKLIATAGGTRTVFWGRSIGGFAALYYSWFFPDSLAVPVNPQTDLRRTPLTHQRAYARHAHGFTDGEDYQELFETGLRSNLIDHYAGPVPNNILYLQNSGDDHHWEHMEPFVASLHRDAHIRVLMQDWGPGHVARPDEYLGKVAATLTASRGPWSSVLQSSELGETLLSDDSGVPAAAAR